MNQISSVFLWSICMPWYPSDSFVLYNDQSCQFAQGLSMLKLGQSRAKWKFR